MCNKDFNIVLIYSSRKYDLIAKELALTCKCKAKIMPMHNLESFGNKLLQKMQS